MIQSAGARADLAPKHSLGYHLLLEKEASAAREEIAACCSSKNVDEVREP